MKNSKPQYHPPFSDIAIYDVRLRACRQRPLRWRQTGGMATPFVAIAGIGRSAKVLALTPRSAILEAARISCKRTRKREFLDEMRRVVPWSKLTALIEPHYPGGETGRPPFPIATMLQIHFMQQWFGLSDPAMEEALYDVPLYREFAGPDGGMVRLPDESTILRVRHLLETDGLAAQMLALVNEILTEKGLMLKNWIRSRRHPDCRAQFDKERFRHLGSRNALDAERR